MPGGGLEPPTRGFSVLSQALIYIGFSYISRELHQTYTNRESLRLF